MEFLAHELDRLVDGDVHESKKQKSSVTSPYFDRFCPSVIWERRIPDMPQDLASIRTELPAKPDWIRDNASFRISLSKEQIEQLASGCSAFENSESEHGELEVHFMGGRSVRLILVST